MSKFIKESALRGIRPQNLSSTSQIIRNSIISKMVTDREVLRVVCAPNGYGKSTVCAQYAEIMFGFNDVVWLDCSNVLFVRDLDNDSITTTIQNHISDCKLVVFDDLLYLNAERSEIFNENIAWLLDNNIEVLVNFSPLNRPAVELDKNSIWLTAQDLLISHSEKPNVTIPINTNSCSVEVNENPYRVPLVGFSEIDASMLISCNLSNELPQALRFSLFYIYMCEFGHLEMLSSMSKKSNISLLLSYANDFPHLGINSNGDSFFTCNVDPAVVVKIFEPFIDTFCKKYFKLKSKNEMFDKFVEICIENGNINRGYEISRNLCNKTNDTIFVEQFIKGSIMSLDIAQPSLNCKKLLIDITPDTTTKSITESISTKTKISYQTILYYVWGLSIIGARNVAMKIAYGLLQTSSDFCIGILSSLLFYLYGNNSDKQNAIRLMTCFKKPDADSEISDMYLVQLSEIILSLIANIKDDKKLETIIADLTENHDIKMQIYACSLLLYCSQSRVQCIYLNGFDELLANCVVSVTTKTNKDITLTDYLFVEIFNKLHKVHPKVINASADSLALIDDKFLLCQQIISKQRNIFEAKNKGECYFNDLTISLDDGINNLDINKSNKVSINKNSLINTESYIEPLNVNLFTNFSLSIGNRPIPKELYSRKKIKTLIGCLVLAPGNTMSGQHISKCLWPDKLDDTAIKNLNSLWVTTRRALRGKKQKCPYLRRVQNEFSIIPEFLTSDIFCIDLIYETYTLSEIDPILWVDIAKENMNVIRGELLPGEYDNKFICRKRVIYKNKVLDSLLCASERLLEVGKYREALWFARLALDVDSEREDVFYAMMKAQYYSGKRSNAIETYLACKKMIEEESEYPVSQKTEKLFEAIVHETI